MTKKSTINVMSALAGAAVLLTASAATAGPKDLNCMECVESEEIDGTLDANVLDPSVMVEGENVSLLNNDAGYLVSGDFAANLGRVIFLSGDDTPTNNGAALLDAIADINSGDGPCSSPGPSAGAPCLIKLGPGIFETNATLSMVDHVDIEGSGQGATSISGAPPGFSTTLVTGADAELRFLTVDNTKSGETVVPVRAITIGGNNMRITHVTVIANGDNNTTRNVAIGVLGGANTLVLTHVTARTEPTTFTSARAIEMGDSSDLTLHNVTAISAAQALVFVGDGTETVTVNNSLLSGAVSISMPQPLGAREINIHASRLEGTLSPSGDSSVVSMNASQLVGNAAPSNDATVNLGASQLDGSALTGDGTVNCVYVYDGAFAAHACN